MDPHFLLFSPFVRFHPLVMEFVSRFPQAPMHHLPRLAPEFYQGAAAVLWTITIQHRATGWLDPLFHAQFRELLLHACVREGLVCPAYVLMPDHIHILWMGLKAASDQRKAMRFLRRHLGRALADRSEGSVSFELQKQSHDRVLREEDRKRGAVAHVCFYILDNPRRAGLVDDPNNWPYGGAMIPGLPHLNPLQQDFWSIFWEHYWKAREPGLKALLPPRSCE